MVDEFAEKVEQNEKARCYRYGSSCNPIGIRPVTIRYRLPNGKLGSKSFTTYFTHHGPVVRSENGRWITFAMMNKPVEALQQSYSGPRPATSAPSCRSRSSRRIAPTTPSSPTTRARSPISTRSSCRDARPLRLYEAGRRQRPRDRLGLAPLASRAAQCGQSAQRLDRQQQQCPLVLGGCVQPESEELSQIHGYVRRKLPWAARAQASDRKPRLDAREAAGRGVRQLPARLRCADSVASPGLCRATRERSAPCPAGAPIAVLRPWDYRWSGQSVAQTLAMFWGDAMQKALNAPADEPGNKLHDAPRPRHHARAEAPGARRCRRSAERDFGGWRVPWGEVNRFQRISPAIVQPFNDSAPSIPVPFASSANTARSPRSAPRPSPAPSKWYGTYGNSFVAVVEFGPRVRARAVTAGGESGHPASPHFNDEALRYASGICARSISGPTSSRATPSGCTSRGSS